MAARAEPIPQVWESPRLKAGALSAVDHTAIGLRYIIAAILFFCLAGIQVLFIRAQLAVPENTLLSPDVYSQFFTMHGVTMVFFFAAPVLFGLGSCLIPLMIGAREMAFPRLNAFGYWVFLFSGLFMYSSFLFGLAPDGRWLAYTYQTPLRGPQQRPMLNLDFWSLGLIFLSIAFLAGAVNFIVTILRRRAPGLGFSRLPLFAWAVLVTSFAAIPAVLVLDFANVLLVLDRKGLISLTGASLWQRLFPLFSSPYLFLLLLPVVGIVSEIVSVFARRQILGYRLLVWSTAAAALLGLVMWLGQGFTTGLSPSAGGFASIAASVLAIFLGVLGGIQVFAWLATLLTGRPVWKTPLMWVGGAIFLGVLGGLAGVLFLAIPAGRPLAGSYFSVATLHYLAVGGAAFAVFAGFTYWFPRIFQRLLSERLGKLSFWLLFIGVNLTFFPMYLLGLAGMPRRGYTYPGGLGWDGLNLLAAIGALMLAEGVLVFVVNGCYSLFRGAAAGENPWDGRSLEWTGSTPEPGGSPAGRSLLPLSLAALLLVIFVGLLLSPDWASAASAAAAALALIK